MCVYVLVGCTYIIYTHINIFMLIRVTFFIVNNQYLSVKPCVLTEFVLKTHFLINDVMEV